MAAAFDLPPDLELPLVIVTSPIASSTPPQRPRPASFQSPPVLLTPSPDPPSSNVHGAECNPLTPLHPRPLKAIQPESKQFMYNKTQQNIQKKVQKYVRMYRNGHDVTFMMEKLKSYWNDCVKQGSWTRKQLQAFQKSICKEIGWQYQTNDGQDWECECEFSTEM